MPTFLDLDTYRNEHIKDYNFSPSYSTDSSSIDPYIMSSPASSSMSPMSTSSDNSQNAQNFHTLTIRDNEHSYMMMDTQTVPVNNQYDLQGNIIGPHLVILEHPVEKFRFRYKSEMHGTHGSLMGSKSQKTKKTFPTVELRGFKGEAIIRCSLFQTDTLKRSQHSHRLVVRNGEVDHDDPHDVVVSTETGFTAVFQGMGIIHTAKKYIVDELLKKKILEKQVELGRTLSSRDEAQIKYKAEQEAKTMNLNQVCLCFQAFVVENNLWRSICPPVYSNPVNNMKSALTGELKISRLSAAVSSAAGGDDLILLVEKVGKKNIKVRFFELDDEDREVWDAWGVFTEVDVHHQYAIALRTPPYKNQDIQEPVDVFIQLYRPTDHDRSEPMSFKYKPRNYLTSRKRPRITSSFGSNEIPTVVKGLMQTEEPDTISSEYNLSGILNDLNDLPDMCLSSSDFDQFYKTNSGEYQKDLNIKSLQTDGPTSVIKRGPNYSPAIANKEKSRSLNFIDIFKQIITDYRQHNHNDVKLARQKILALIKGTSFNGEYILHWALRSEQQFKIISTLFQLIDKLEMEELLQLKNINNETCLHIVCVHNKPEYIRPLINLGADPNLQDLKGNTPLHVSVELNYLMCASKLLEKSNYTTPKSKELRIDLANDQGMTALHLSVRKNNLNMTKKLLENNASIKLSESKHGYNVLHIAVEQKSEEIVKYLLENTGINVNQTNNSNYTPFHVAIAIDDNESKPIIKLLLKYNADPTLVNGANFNKMVDNDNDNDDSDDDYSDNEMDNEPANSNSYQLAQNKPEILQILNEYSQRTISETDDSNLEIDENSGSSMQAGDESDPMSVKFDDICVEELSGILNKSQAWKNLANSLGFQGQIKIWERSHNPTKMLLKFIEVENISLTTLVSILQNIFQPNAVNAIDEMIARHLEIDD